MVILNRQAIYYPFGFVLLMAISYRYLFLLGNLLAIRFFNQLGNGFITYL